MTIEQLMTENTGRIEVNTAPLLLIIGVAVFGNAMAGGDLDEFISLLDEL